MNIYIVRHGETEANVKKLVCGQLDTPLTQRGIEQAKKLQSTLKKINFDHVITTPLQRACQTAALAYPEKKFIEISDLMETNTGDMSLWTLDELQAFDPRFLQHGMHADLKYQNGESIRDLYHRITKWFAAFVNENKNDNNILIVGHGGTVNVILHYIFQIPITFYPAFSVENASYTKVYLDAETNQRNLVEYNKK